MLELEARTAAFPRVSVVIPARNEAANLPFVLEKLPPEYEVVIVDGASTDDTIAVARDSRPDAVIVCQRGTGKGDAVALGFARTTGDIIVMADADGSMDLGEIPRFVEALLAGADFAKGSRFLPAGGSTDITLLRSLGNRGLTLLVNVLFRTQYTDLCYGFNAFWSEHLAVLGVDSPGFEIEALLNVRAAKARLVVAEIASHEGRRLHGQSNLRVWRDGWRILRTIVAERLRRGPAIAPALDMLRPLEEAVSAAASEANRLR